MIRGTQSWLVAYPEYVVVSGTGRFHIRYRVPVGPGLVHRTVDDGRCGADDNWKTVSVIPEGIDQSQLCEFCWPKEE